MQCTLSLGMFPSTSSASPWAICTSPSSIIHSIPSAHPLPMCVVVAVAAERHEVVDHGRQVHCRQPPSCATICAAARALGRGSKTLNVANGVCAQVEGRNW